MNVIFIFIKESYVLTVILNIVIGGAVLKKEVWGYRTHTK